ncbi:hypothetical protein WJX73_006373 [Symbiochloris irregularis]|uniref:Uncharacterized protein n=1 Tax=Symbiochloris irregularis TaxID=706552 RepID=A0AAW1P4X4_9CHLO
MSLAIMQTPLSLRPGQLVGQPIRSSRIAPLSARRSLRVAALFGGGKKKEKTNEKDKKKLTPDQYSQLARNARGSYKDFFKDFVEEKTPEDYVDSTSGTQVPFLPILFFIVAALIVSTVLVAQNTAPAGAPPV